jgi:hypothetical protein
VSNHKKHDLNSDYHLIVFRHKAIYWGVNLYRNDNDKAFYSSLYHATEKEAYKAGLTVFFGNKRFPDLQEQA